MSESWPHAPPHHFTAKGTYIITAATLHRLPLFNTDAKLDLFRDTTFELARDYKLLLQAWAFFANHYHLVASFENVETEILHFIRHLHRELAIRLNRLDATPGRRVLYEFWDTELTFEKSWLARLNYVHQNPVHHGRVADASEYPWCSARCFSKATRDQRLLNRSRHSKPTG